MDQTSIVIEEIATPQNFVEVDYLAANPDVAAAVRKGTCWSGRLHFHEHGRNEGRRIRRAVSIAQAQEEKIGRLEPLIRLDLPHVRRGAKYDFLADELRTRAGTEGADTIAAPEYEGLARQLIEQFRDGWILDCGAGKRPVYYANVVNYETVDYESTDILGPGEVLPFRDASFDAVLSLSVLEHAHDPFACAAEIARVLKPGATLICAAPFLQPAHRHPDHYFNMTGEGLRALFDHVLEIDEHVVAPSSGPVQALTELVHHWANGLNGRALDEFLAMRLGDLLRSPGALHDRPWVRELSNEKNFELASATMITARKPK
jgi:SAM-dependent methyltransferase